MPLPRSVGRQITLLGRAENENAAAQVRAAVDQIEQILRGVRADRRVGIIELKAFRLRQQPVQADHGQPRALDRAPNAEPVRAGEVGHYPAQGEWRQFQPVIAKFGRKSRGLLQGPAFEEFIADGVPHRIGILKCHGPLRSPDQLAQKRAFRLDDLVIVTGSKVFGYEQFKGEGALGAHGFEVVDQLGNVSQALPQACAAPFPRGYAVGGMTGRLGQTVTDMAMCHIRAEQLQPHACIFNGYFYHVLYIVNGADVIGIQIAQQFERARSRDRDGAGVEFIDHLDPCARASSVRLANPARASMNCGQ